MDDKMLERAFLEELEALEKFRLAYTGMYPQVPLSREDPDVRRMLEAMAFFSGRTRLAAERQVNESLTRLFRQHFPYVLSPLPAMTMLQAEVTPRCADTIELPRGMDVIVERRQSPGRPYQFRTAAPVRVLPIRLDSVIPILTTRGRVRRVMLTFSGEHSRNDDIGKLSLYINHQSNLDASIRVLFALRNCVKSAGVTHEQNINDTTRLETCEVSFGALRPEPHEFEAFENPVEQFRAFLHFPQAELFFHIDVPRPARNWREFTVCLDLGEDWPVELRLTTETFVLHAVPMVNIRRDMANPIECDGTRERYPVRYPDVSAGYAPHSILGVYLMTEAGMLPAEPGVIGPAKDDKLRAIEPGVLGPTKDGFEVTFEGKDESRRAWVYLQLPGAFENPQTVAVEALWFQPGLLGARAEELQAQLADRHTEGLNWSCGSAIAEPASSDVEDDRDDLVALLGLKSQRFLRVEDLTFLARVLGSLRKPPFAKLTLGLTRVDLDAKPAGRKASGVCYQYVLQFENLTPSELPWLDLFCRKLLGLLQAWSVEQIVEILARVPRLQFERRYAE